MTATLVRRLNIARFERLLLSETGVAKRAMITLLLAEERTKADSAYPLERR
jgi:hypothetical protein